MGVCVFPEYPLETFRVEDQMGQMNNRSKRGALEADRRRRRQSKNNGDKDLVE